MQNNQYLTITQMAKACSISRASLLRMEKDGILIPAYINPENGYRYYDSKNVLRVIRNTTLQELGFTHKELRNYYDTSDNYQEMIRKLQEKMDYMEYHISSLKLQLQQYPHLSINHFKFPELYCYTYRMKNVTDLTSVRPNIWKIFSQAVQEGYSLYAHMHPFVLVDYLKMEANNFENTGYDYEICIPVIPTGKKDNLKYFPSTDTLSTILYGGAKDVPIAFSYLSEEIIRASYVSDSHARVIAAVSSYPGEEIPKEYWALRICIPISRA